jgi:electron transfer flavoprotein alpha subunit
MLFVIAEQRDGVLNRASWEAVAAAQQMGGPVTVVIAGGDVSAVAAELAAADVTDVLALQHAALAAYTPDGFVEALAAVVGAGSASHVVLAHTYQTRDFVPKLAARLDRALVTDCTGVTAHDTGFAFTRPMFQGKVSADVVLDGPAPHLATFQIGAFRADAVRKGSAPAPVRSVTAAVDPAAIREKPEPPFREARQAVDLTQADRIVAVGRGIKDKDHIALAQQLAAALGAELAASRPICDAGWLPIERQIGSSGQTVAPRLYLALGISGAIQHVVGMKGSRTIVAINKDAEAPIFEVADYGIVGDLFEVVPAMIAALNG